MPELQHLDLDITGIAHGGFGVARSDEGRVIFVSDALPGERVRAAVTDDSKKSFWYAQTVAVLESSPHRREHPWAEAGLDRAPGTRAGGADFGHIELSHQRELKQQVLRDSLQRFGKLSPEKLAAFDLSVQPIDDGDGLGWRTRISLAVDKKGSLGVFAERSRNHVPVQSIPLAVPELQQRAPLGENFRGASRVDLVWTSTGEYRIIIDRKGSSKVITEQLDDRNFQLPELAFWQVHPRAAATIARAVVEFAAEAGFNPDAKNLDLYAGLGLLTAALADHFDSGSRIVSVEFDADASKFAAKNLQELPMVTTFKGETLHFLRQETADHVKRADFDTATVVLDPPRTGAGKPVITELGKLKPVSIIYVACDPVALSRDIAYLAEVGYQPIKLQAFDLFPNTHHFETIVLFQRS